MKNTITNFKGENLIGQNFGRLKVVDYAGKDNQRMILWRCECSCGNTSVARGTALRFGNTKSCGCLQKEVTAKALKTHGLSGGKKGRSRLYKTWQNMKTRCFNPNAPKYKNHGGRGICVCEAWLEYVNFHNWAIENGYKEHLTLERIDNDGDYEPNNCKWATYKEQSLNTRQNHLITYQNKTMTLSEWAKLLKMKYTTLRCRIAYYQWPIDKAIETPVQKRRQKK